MHTRSDPIGTARALGLDENSTWSTFASDWAAVRAAEAHGGSAALAALLDERVSWLVAALDVDLCYDRAALRDAAGVVDVEARRTAAWQVLRAFDAPAERRNARRVASELRWSRRPGAKVPLPVLLAGREVRADS
jgi:hypothetical protein